MGNLRAVLAAGVVCLFACGSKNSPAAIDAPVIPDAPPDAPPDSPPDAPAGDFSCITATAPTTADNPITIGGLAGTVSTSGLSPVGGVVIDIFKAGVATKVDSVTSADVTGAFTSDNPDTGNVPFDGFVEATLTDARTTFVFPSNPLAASFPTLPVPLVTTATFTTITTGLMLDQDDTANGAMFVLVTDCAGMPLDKAELSIKQGGTTVGTTFYLGILSKQAIGAYFVFNVPDGDTDVSAKFANMQFATHTVKAFKANATDIAAGSITATNVIPGP
jgi:hypothetical protein